MQYNDCAHCGNPISMFKRLCEGCGVIEHNDLVEENKRLNQVVEKIKENINSQLEVIPKDCCQEDDDIRKPLEDLKQLLSEVEK